MESDASFDLEKLLERLQNRREFLQLFGKGLGYSALVAALPACGSSSSMNLKGHTQLPQLHSDHKNRPGYPAIKAGIQVCLSLDLEKDHRVNHRVCVPWCCDGAGNWKISDRRQSSATLSLLESGTEDAWLFPLTPVISLQDKRLAGLDNGISKRLGYSF